MEHRTTRRNTALFIGFLLLGGAMTVESAPAFTLVLRLPAHHDSEVR